MQCLWIFSTPYPTLLTIIYPRRGIMLRPQTQSVQQITPFMRANHAVDNRTAAQPVADRPETR